MAQLISTRNSLDIEAQVLQMVQDLAVEAPEDLIHDVVKASVMRAAGDADKALHLVLDILVGQNSTKPKEANFSEDDFPELNPSKEDPNPLGSEWVMIDEPEVIECPASIPMSYREVVMLPSTCNLRDIEKRIICQTLKVQIKAETPSLQDWTEYDIRKAMGEDGYRAEKISKIVQRARKLRSPKAESEHRIMRRNFPHAQKRKIWRGMGVEWA